MPDWFYAYKQMEHLNQARIVSLLEDTELHGPPVGFKECACPLSTADWHLPSHVEVDEGAAASYRARFSVLENMVELEFYSIHHALKERDQTDSKMDEVLKKSQTRFNILPGIGK